MTTSGPRLGREAILDAASVLMDERGIDDVSLNEINRASGHRNRSAATYHFGTRDAVVSELFQRTMTVVDAERIALLDHAESAVQSIGPRTGIELIVGPYARQLRTIEGRQYLRLCAQLIDHPRYVQGMGEVIAVNRSVQRAARWIAPALAHLPPAIAAERAAQIPAYLVRACADQARLADSDTPPRRILDLESFIVNVVDTILAMLAAPTSITVEAAAS
jgi:AcrR family transcriptional regulator